MVDPPGGARPKLLATYLASLSDTDKLRQLFKSEYWSTTCSSADALEILLKFLPEAADPASYFDLVSDIANNTLDEDDDPDTNNDSMEQFQFDELMPSGLRQLDDKIAERVLSNLYESLAPSPFTAKIEFYKDNPELTLSSWVFARVYLADYSLGVLTLADDLVSLSSVPAPVKQWRQGVLNPLKKYLSYYPQNYGTNKPFNLHDFTAVDPTRVIEYFLSHTSAKSISRDVTSIVTPYIDYISEASGTQKLHPWRKFFEWMVTKAAAKGSNLSASGFGVIVELVKSWSGPDFDGAMQFEYISAVIASCYQCQEASSEYFEAMHAMQKRAAVLLSNTGKVVIDDKDITHKMQDYSSFDNAVKFPGSPLFQASDSNLHILDALITSASMISVYVPTDLQAMARLRFFSSHEAEYQFLLKVVRGSSKEYAYRDDSNWRALRSGARWLKNKSMVLSKLSDTDIENIFLGALLDFGSKYDERAVD